MFNISSEAAVNALFAFVTAMAVSFGATPVVRILAKNIGAVDVPRDNRRMHKVPIPRMGGLAIFLGFVTAALLFGRIDTQMKSILMGAVVLIILGIADDMKPLPALFKLVVQIGAAMIPISNGVRAYSIANPFVEYDYIRLGAWAVPFTIIWIVGMINAVNFIDGLDGLAVGISSIASFSMLIVAALVSEPYVVIIMAAVAGSCIGFMPFNMNPAKIFMGDTGSMFLGYILAVMSIQGMFKFYAIVTFVVPFIVLALPIIDTLFAIIRRIIHGKSPFAADRGHVHHRLVDLGFNQKQTVAILYAISAVLGLSGVVLTTSGEAKILVLVLAVIVAVFFGITVYAYDIKKEKNQVKKDESDDKKD